MLKQLKKIWIGCVYAMTALLLISCRSANKELSDAEAKKAAVSELIKILELGREPESVSTGILEMRLLFCGRRRLSGLA